MRHLVLFGVIVMAAACSGDGSSSTPSSPNNPETPPTVYVVTLDSGVVVDSITAPAGSAASILAKVSADSDAVVAGGTLPLAM